MMKFLLIAVHISTNGESLLDDCVRVEEIDDPLMREIRCLDKLVDELAKGKPLEQILRKQRK